MTTNSNAWVIFILAVALIMVGLFAGSMAQKQYDNNPQLSGLVLRPIDGMEWNCTNYFVTNNYSIVNNDNFSDISTDTYTNYSCAQYSLENSTQDSITSGDITYVSPSEIDTNIIYPIANCSITEDRFCPNLNETFTEVCNSVGDIFSNCTEECAPLNVSAYGGN